MFSRSAGFVAVITLTIGLSLSAQADTLLVRSVGTTIEQKDTRDFPHRGMSMVDVMKKYGTPEKKMEPVGKNNKRRFHHAISRWVYKDFTVYFAEKRVINTINRR